ncbi:MAG: trehalose-phosphatase [Pseudomonadota bacterium]
MTPPVPDRPAVFLDFDGTLVDIVARPEDVAVAPDLLPVIDKLVARVDGAVAVVTGRKVSDVDHFLAMPIAAAGMHGLERRSTPGGEVVEAEPPPEIAILRQRILAWPALQEGVRMEDKGAGLAVHYRAVPDRAQDVKTKMAEMTADLDTLGLIDGKMVVEAKGKGHDKGEAVDVFMASAPFAGRTPIFIGDDTTDEDGMRAAQALGGFGIKVGEGPTEAQYRVADVAAVHEYLKSLANGG